ncbi:MAG: hypothetical protein A2Y34_03985 [Spirochaetes bacterium GWC1_27_15]|nr:MAG: hypothetical protein A2Y34_03985 [Spirochaetes bacterium GWC1_27_15]
MLTCRKCEHYQPKDLTGMSLVNKLQSVSGFCMDSNNPDFNEYARNFGRGIYRTDSYITPNWCAKRKNPKGTVEYYTQTMYVAVTDKGYIKGDNYQGVEFVGKENARQFTNQEAFIYRKSIAADMFDFYKCNSFWFEEV